MEPVIPLMAAIMGRTAGAEGAGSTALPVSIDVTRQHEIEGLCHKLFRKRSLITSGRLQLIGLEKVKQRFGAQWEERYGAVTRAAEEAFARHLSAGDLYLRYKDDTYIIIFDSPTREEGEEKAAAISAEICRRLFAEGHEDLRSITIKKHIVRAYTVGLAGKPLHEIMESLLAAEGFSQGAGGEEIPSTPPRFSFIPLWDVAGGAITTYLLRAETQKQGHVTDYFALQKAAAELARQQKEGKAMTIYCPVSYQTLAREEHWQKYKDACRDIPPAQRQHLAFMVTRMTAQGLRAGGARAVYMLGKLGCAVFVELVIDGKVDLSPLRYAGLDAAGLSLGRQCSEQDAMAILKDFAEQARSVNLQKKFVTDVPSISLATASVCTGFDYLSGPAVKAGTDAPSGVHPFRREDLLKKSLQD